MEQTSYFHVKCLTKRLLNNTKKLSNNQTTFSNNIRFFEKVPLAGLKEYFVKYTKRHKIWKY